jgi:hypothetical protein
VGLGRQLNSIIFDSFKAIEEEGLNSRNLEVFCRIPRVPEMETN